MCDCLQAQLPNFLQCKCGMICQVSRCSQVDLRPLSRAAAQAREASTRCRGVISPSLQQLYAALGMQPQPNAWEEAEALVASVAAGESI